MSTHHIKTQRERLNRALAASTEAARKAKKGKAGIVAQMKRRGYVPSDNPNSTVGWKNIKHTIDTDKLVVD